MRKRVHRVTQHRSVTSGVAAMTLFSNHAFPRHAHDQYGIGLITSGAQRSWSLIGETESVAGDVIMVNPGEIHDGTPLGAEPRGWRILYFEPRLLHAALAEESAGQEPVVPPVVRDPDLRAQVARLFRRVDSRFADSEALEESLLSCLMSVVQRHRLGGSRLACASPSVRKAIRHIDAAPAAATSLTALADLCGISRFQLLRGFAREVGTTPHAYVVQRRVRLVRQLLAAGESPADAALVAGFADQSHMTRAFVRHFGVTPARFRTAIA